MSFLDEPFLEDDGEDQAAKGEREEIDLRARIERLVEGQSFAVLSTQGHGQPYGSLVAYAMGEDMRFAAFATLRATRKFRLLSECANVALVIDNRPDFPGELMKIEAVTATGKASLIEDDGEFDRWATLLTKRHPYLTHFVRSTSCGLFRVRIVRYLHVCRFQEVRQWIPDEGG